MSYKDPTYVVFDGDKDKWAYAFMKGWKQSEKVDFDFRDAHDLDQMTSRAQDENYVKSQLRERMKKSAAVVVLVGDNTKNLYKFVRWELDLALELGLPIIVVNLNNKTQIDRDLCPAIIRDECAVHIPFKLAAIKHALDTWPAEVRGFDAQTRSAGSRYYDSTW
jgi:antiphage defense system Thoeris ThsB-like protein